MKLKMIISAAFIALFLCSCSTEKPADNSESKGITSDSSSVSASDISTEISDDIAESSEPVLVESSEVVSSDTSAEKGNTLVAYFSATGNTKQIAEYIGEVTGGTLYEITALEPYTEDDLKYYTDCRADKEQSDPYCRPKISGKVDDIDKYDTVFLGYPIWHAQAPKIMYTFLESYDFSGKKIIPFCTSGSSPIGSSAENLKPSASEALWSDGTRFSANTSKSDIESYIADLDMSVETADKNEEEKTVLKITVGEKVFEAELADNSSAEAFAELLKQGAVTVDMSDYGNFEKVGPLPQSLPQNNEQITTEPGDIILYLGNSITIYYDTNSWNFTRLGKIKNITQDELINVLGKGDVTVTFSV